MLAIVVNTDTVTAADAYFNLRFNTTEWDDADANDRLIALTTASRVLYSVGWRGTPASVDVAFPRHIPGDPYYRADVARTPEQVLQAVYEQALHILKNKDIFAEEGSVESLSIGPLDFENIKETPQIPKIVWRMIGEYANGASGGGSWWRAN